MLPECCAKRKYCLQQVTRVGHFREHLHHSSTVPQDEILQNNIILTVHLKNYYLMLK